MRLIAILLEGSVGQKYIILQDIWKYFINFGMMMAFPIFDINKKILYNHIEKSRVLFFNELLSNKHAAPSIFNFLKPSVSCGHCGIIHNWYLTNTLSFLSIIGRYQKEIQLVRKTGTLVRPRQGQIFRSIDRGHKNFAKGSCPIPPLTCLLGTFWPTGK